MESTENVINLPFIWEIGDNINIQLELHVELATLRGF